MDPTETFLQLAEASSWHQHSEAVGHIESLLAWLENDGFLPEFSQGVEDEVACVSPTILALIWGRLWAFMICGHRHFVAQELRTLRDFHETRERAESAMS